MKRLLQWGFPSVCIGLGTWQLYRLRWKRNLINEIDKGLNEESISLAFIPDNVEAAYKFRRIKLFGRPVLSQNSPFIWLGPRNARDVNVDFAYELIIPFELKEDKKQVMVNYGKVPVGKENQVVLPTNDTCVEVVLDRAERKSFALSKNQPEAGKWYYKDLNEMSQTLKTSEPLLFKRITSSSNNNNNNNNDSPSGQRLIPIPFRPKIELSNRHFEYVLTWYGIAALSFAMGLFCK